MQTVHISSPDSIIKAIKWPLLVLWALLGLPALIALIVDVINGEAKIENDFLLIGFTHFFLFIFWYIVSRLEVHLNKDTIIFKNAIRTTTIYWSDIKESAISFFFIGNGAGIQWLFVYGDNKRKAFEPAYFSKKNNRLIAAALVDKCPNARIAIEVWGMAKGRFPWYFLW